MNQDQILIYGVCDPRTSELRYIGKTKRSLQRRAWEQLGQGRLARRRTHRSNWFKSLHEAGVQPDFFVIEIVTEATWREDEQFWIAYFRALGARLVNTSIGGDGATGVADTPEIRLKKSIGNKGKRKSPAHRAKVLALPQAFRPGNVPHNTGKQRSAETKAKISAANKRNGHRPTGGLQKGDHQTEEAKAKISETLKRKHANGTIPHWSKGPNAAEIRARISERKKAAACRS